jgi:hypothetical protein
MTEEEKLATMRFHQRLREEMRKHGLTEVAGNVYTGGEIRDGKMAVVHVLVQQGASEEELVKACQVAANAYKDTVK